MSNLLTYHNLYTVLYFVITYLGILTIAYFDTSFKKGKKWLCLSSIMAIMMVPVYFLIKKNHFVNGSEAFPWWFFLAPAASFIPIMLWTEGNAFLNWLNIIIINDFSMVVLEFPIGMASTMFIKSPHPIFYNYDSSDFPLVIPFVIVVSVITVSALYMKKIWNKIFSRKWLANLMYVIGLLPMSILGFFYASADNGMYRAHITLTQGIISTLTLPLTIYGLLLIYYLKEKIVEKNRIRQLELDNVAIFEDHKRVTALVQKTAVWRHDIRNHLEVIEYALLKNHSFESNSEKRNEIKEILKLTDHILSESKQINIQEYTGRPILDSLLSIKLQTAHNQNTELEYQLSLPKECMIADYDLVTICSNLLDNALEACMKLAENKRSIQFYIYEKKDYFCFDIINPFVSGSDDISFFQTSKRNPKEHGYGIKIIRDITRKYHGYLNITNDKSDTVRVFVALKR